MISIGVKCEDQREFYAENTDVDLLNANDFVKENVIPNLQFINKPAFIDLDQKSGDIEMKSKKKRIADMVKMFIDPHIPEFWGYYADYDWVVFCWLFGCMIDLPKGWPMYCRDLKQLADSLDKSRFDDPKGEHNALADARWNMEFYNYLMEGSNGQKGDYGSTQDRWDGRG